MQPLSQQLRLQLCLIFTSRKHPYDSDYESNNVASKNQPSDRHVTKISIPLKSWQTVEAYQDLKMSVFDFQFTVNYSTVCQQQLQESHFAYLLLNANAS